MTDANPDEVLLDGRRIGVLCASIAIVAACGIVYELLIATVGTYLIGDGVRRFSFTVGGFMAAMGIGAWASRFIRHRLVAAFVWVEIVLAVVGGASTAVLFAAFPAGLHHAASWTLILIIGTLVGLEIPLIARLLAAHGGARTGIANALGFDYVGAVVGSIAFPLLLLPHLGLFRASFAVGFVNALVAVATAAAFRGRIPGSGRLLVAASAAAVVLVAGMFASDAMTRIAEDRLFADRVIFREQTPYQRVVLTREDVSGEHRLYIDGHVQFAEFDEYRYHESLVLPLLGHGEAVRRVLVLGGGDGLATREILRHPGIEAVTIVDLDPAITRLARELPALRRLNESSLDDPRVTVVHDDAFRWVRDRPEDAPAWDRVVIDLPDPHGPALAKLYSEQFYRMLQRILAPGGAVVTQSGSPFWTPEAFWTVHLSLEAAGYDVIPYHVTVPAFGPWGFQLARPAGSPPIESIRTPARARFMTPETFAAARVFGPDVADDSGAQVNSIFEPVLHRLYRLGVERGRPPIPPDAAGDARGAGATGPVDGGDVR